MVVSVVEELERRFRGVRFYNARLTEVQDNVLIGSGTRIGSFTLVHEGAVIGVNCTIGSHCNICYCSIGDGVSIQTGCHITRGVTIEDGVFIGPGVVTLNDPLKDTGLHYPIIRKGARVGGGSVILPGVVIGEGAVIGAGSVVTRDVAKGEVAYGNPSRPSRSRVS